MCPFPMDKPVESYRGSKGGGSPTTPMQRVLFQESRGRSIKDFLTGKEWRDTKRGTQGDDGSTRPVPKSPETRPCTGAGNAEEPGFD